MVFYRAIPSILIDIYVYSTRSFYRSIASNSLRISWGFPHFVDAVDLLSTVLDEVLAVPCQIS